MTKINIYLGYRCLDDVSLSPSDAKIAESIYEKFDKDHIIECSFIPQKGMLINLLTIGDSFTEDQECLLEAMRDDADYGYPHKILDIGYELNHYTLIIGRNQNTAI